MNDIGKTLRNLRSIYGYQLKEVAQMIGISANYLSEIEHGKKHPSLKILTDLATVFDMKLSSLILLSEELQGCTSENKGKRCIQKMMLKLINIFSKEDSLEK